MAKGAVNQLCSNVWYCIFFFSIVFISLLSIGWVQGNRRKCSPHRGVSDQAVLSASHQKTCFSQGKILCITHSNAVHPSLDSLSDNRCGVPKPEKSAVDFSIITVAIQGDQTMVLGQIGRQVSTSPYRMTS